MHRITASLVAVLSAGCLAEAPARFTTLAIAARTGDLATMHRLLASGVSPNVVDPGGNRWTPLLHAIHKEQLASVDLLVRSGADPKLSVNNLQPLLMAVEEAATARSAPGPGRRTRTTARIVESVSPASTSSMYLATAACRSRRTARGTVAYATSRISMCLNVNCTSPAS